MLSGGGGGGGGGGGMNEWGYIQSGFPTGNLCPNFAFDLCFILTKTFASSALLPLLSVLSLALQFSW